MKPIIANKVYIPIDLVDEETVKEHYERDLYVEQSCKKCPIMLKGLPRPNKIGRFACYECPWGAYTGHFVSYSRVQIKGHSYWAVPSGDLPKVEENLNISLKKAIDLRCDRLTRYPIKFTKKLFTGKELRNGELAPNQVQVIKDLFKSPGQCGVIKAKPRSGKTVLAVYTTCKMQRTTVIFAHEKLLLDQFYKTFLDFTNIREVEKKAGKKLIVIAKTEKDLKSDAPILLVNYQKFISELGLKRVAKYLTKKYGLAIVDEIHRSSSARYNDLLNRLDPKRRIGLTATDNRKDGKYVLTLETLGRVVAEGTVGAMTPVVYVRKTNYLPKRQWRGRRAYGNATKWLSENKERNIEIVKQIFSDLRKNEQTSIVIPVLTIKHARSLTKMVNRQAAYNNDYKGEKWNPVLAEMLWAKANKKDLLDRARKFKTRVVITIAKFVRDGIDVPAWSHMYILFPGSNVENSYQNTQRICTPYEGKKKPVIRLWHDPVDIMVNCVKNTYKDSYIPLGYKIGKDSKETLDNLLESVKIKGGTWKKTGSLEDSWGNSIKPMKLTTRIKTR